MHYPKLPVAHEQNAHLMKPEGGILLLGPVNFGYHDMGESETS